MAGRVIWAKPSVHQHPPEQLMFLLLAIWICIWPSNTGWYKRPDWFAVLVSLGYIRTRLAWLCVVARRVRPVVVINHSPGTQDEDLGKRAPGKTTGKWKVYEQIFGCLLRTFNHITMVNFPVVGRKPISTMESIAGRIWMPDLELGCSLWQGEYQGALRQWLRRYDAKRQLGFYW